MRILFPGFVMGAFVAACACGGLVDKIKSLGNSAPVAPSVSVSPDDPWVVDSLSCEVGEASDPDGDPLTVTREWLRDGEVVSVEGDDVPSEATGGGQTWTCRVTVSDGKLEAVAEASVEIADDDTAPGQCPPDAAGSRAPPSQRMVKVGPHQMEIYECPSADDTNDTTAVFMRLHVDGTVTWSWLAPGFDWHEGSEANEKQVYKLLSRTVRQSNGSHVFALFDDGGSCGKGDVNCDSTAFYMIERDGSVKYLISARPTDYGVATGGEFFYKDETGFEPAYEIGTLEFTYVFREGAFEAMPDPKPGTHYATWPCPDVGVPVLEPGDERAEVLFPVRRGATIQVLNYRRVGEKWWFFYRIDNQREFWTTGWRQTCVG